MVLKEIRKRDGKVAPFDKEKITDAIFKAAAAVGGKDRQVAEKLNDEVVKILERDFTKYRIPSVEDVQDVVEKVLIESGHAKTAKAYILYRQERTKIREEARKILDGRFTRMYKQLSLNALRVLAGRYLMRDLDGHVMESPEEMLDRVAKTLADIESNHEKSEAEIQKLYQDFSDVMLNLEFLPAGRTLANAGASTRLVSNCIVLHMEDSMAGIFETLKNAAQLQQAGSGLGFPFHLLRPAGMPAVRSRGVASGPVSFLRVYDKAFGVIKQQGRHGANMAVMKVTHPDILEYVHCKAKEGEIKNFNISVAVTDEFMERVMNNDSTPWMCEWRGSEIKPRRIMRDMYDHVIDIKEETLTARELMEEIISAAWSNGEPGIIFIDSINKTNPVPGLGPIEACNPCGEQYLHDGDVCNLGSINLDKFVKDGEVDWQRLEYVTRTATRMLDNVIDITDFPVEKVNRVFRSNRRIGLGIMGFGDLLYRLKIPYNSPDGVKMGEKVMKFINDTAHKTSQELAEEKGEFPNWKLSIFYPDTKMRNAALTCIAPTGSISMICDVSSGVEPYFALVYVKSQVMGGQTLYYVNKHLEKELKDRGLYSDELMNKIAKTGSVQNIKEIPDDIKRVFVTALDILPEDHMRMQAAFQKHVDNSISKTCNFPYEATKEDVLRAYLSGWQLGCKSLTVYRSGSRQVEVLKLVEQEEEKEVSEEQIKTEPTIMVAAGQGTEESCPECNGRIQYTEGCKKCSECGWGICTT